MRADDPPAGRRAVGISYMRTFQRLKTEYVSVVVNGNEAVQPVEMIEIMRDDEV